jgi:hypothetical protein
MKEKEREKEKEKEKGERTKGLHMYECMHVCVNDRSIGKVFLLCGSSTLVRNVCQIGGINA